MPSLLPPLNCAWRILLLLMLGALVACTPEVVPTLIPTATEVVVTNTPEPSPTATHTATPSPTPNVPQTNAPNPADQAYLRVVHASPSLPSVDFYVDGLNFASFMEYGLFTEPSGLVAGTYTLSIRSAGVRDATETLTRQDFSLNGQETLTVVLYGTPETPRLLLYKEDNRPLSANQTRIALINVTAEGETVTMQQGSQSLFGDVANGVASSSAVVPSVELRYNVRANGQIIGANTLRLRERQNYTFVIASNLADPTKAQIFTLTSGVLGIASISTLNMVNGVTVDVLANAVTLGEGMGYLYQSDPQRLPSGDYTIFVYAQGVDRANVAPLASYQTTFIPDEDLTFIVLGQANDVRILPYRANSSPVTQGFARVTFLNTLPNVARVQMQSNVNEPFQMNYGQLIEAGELPIGSFPMTWYALVSGQASGEPLELVTDFALEDGRSYLYLFTGRGEQTPLVLSKTVDVLVPAFIASTAEAALAPLESSAPTVRGINAVDGLTVEFRVDDVPFATSILSRNTSSPVTLSSGERTFTLLNGQTGELMARLTITLETGKPYSIVAYGRADTGFQLDSFTDENIAVAQGAPTLRLIHLSEDSVSLGLGYQNGTGLVFPDLSAPATVGENGEPSQNLRISLPIGLTRLFRNVQRPDASAITIVEEGVKDIFIIDDIATQVGNIRPNVSLQKDTHYDVIAYQVSGTVQIEAFIIALPPQ